MIFQELTLIAVEEWLVQLAMFMSKKIGLIKFLKKKMAKKIC